MLKLARPPADEDELHLTIKALWGVNLPRTKVCPDHCSPFDAVTHAYFTHKPNHAIWYASRGSGKSLALATLGLTVAFIRDIDVNVLGGSSWQSQNVRKHMTKLLQATNAPRWALKRDLVSVIETASGHLLTPLPASQTSVRGPHPPLTLLDECLAGATRIDTPAGPRRIDSLVAGSTVRTWSGVDREVLAARCTGVKATLRLSFADGRQLLVTANHPVAARGGWVRADALRPGDLVLALPATPDWSRQAEDRDVPCLLASEGARDQDRLPLPGLRRGVLADGGARPGALPGVLPARPGGQVRELPGLRSRSQAGELDALPAVLGQASVQGWDDRANGAGPGDRAENRSADQQARGRDDGAACDDRGALSAFGSARGVDRGLCTAPPSGSDRSSRGLLARPAFGDRARRAQAQATDRAGLPGALPTGRVEPPVVALAAVESGPELPVYNLTVAGEHTYLAEGILVHNCDEMDWDIYSAAMGQAMETINERGELVEEYIVSSSTWQNPDGTFTKILDQAREKDIPIFTWCWRELLTTHGGWMSPEFIARKKTQVTKAMWRVEYELGEPAGDSRAFDPEAVEEYFVHYLRPREGVEAHYYDDKPLFERYADRKDDMPDVDDLWVFELPDPLGMYAAGADWAKERDKTVLAVIRFDVHPRRLVYLRRMGKMRYPVMSGRYGAVVKAYSASAFHDKTGVGNAINDYMTEEAQHGFDFTNRSKRTQMLIDFIADFEFGAYRLPREISPLWTGLRRATTADVYAPSTAKTHLPDEVVAMALAHRAAGNIPRGEIEIPDLPTTEAPRRIDAGFHEEPPAGAGARELVSVVDERAMTRTPVGVVTRRKEMASDVFGAAEPLAATDDDWWWR